MYKSEESLIFRRLLCSASTWTVIWVIFWFMPIMVSALSFGCSRGEEEFQDMKKNFSRQSIDVLSGCSAVNELKDFYAAESLGHRVEIREGNRLISVQTFPYSGILASHLYLYTKEKDQIVFSCFFRVQSQNSVVFESNDDGSVEMRVGGKRIVLFN